MENYLKNKGTLYDANSNINRFNRSNVNDAGYNIISNAPLNSQLKTTNYNKVAGGENKNLLSRLSNLSQASKNINQSTLSRTNNSRGILSNVNTSYVNNIDRTQVDSSRSFSDINKLKPNRDTEIYQPYNLYANKEKDNENFYEEKLKRDISKNNISREIKEINTSSNDISISPTKTPSYKTQSINDFNNSNNYSNIKSGYNVNSGSQLNSFRASTPTPNQGSLLSLKQVGFDNLGNTCFMNTSLQCLIHTESFMKRFFDEKDRITGISYIRPTPLSKAILELCDEILKKSDVGKNSVAPTDFKRLFGSAHRMFSGYSQHDSQEFLRVLLDDISQELNRIVSMPKYRELDTKINDKVTLNKEYDRLCKAREDSIVMNTFSLQIVNIFTCLDCNYETYSFEKYTDIPILLEKESFSGIEMSSLLDEFFGSDKLKWETPCENGKCKKKSIHSKFVKLSSLPEILMLSFQRNNGRARRKNTSTINFKEKIDLSKYVDKDCIGSGTSKYNLYAVSNHSGSLDFGHYFAYIKLKDTWYEFNDSFISKCYTFNNNSSTAYVLFYRREDV